MKISELISELAIQISQYGDMPVKVMVDGAYHGGIDLAAMVKPPPTCEDDNFLTLYAFGDFFYDDRKGGGEGGFLYDDDDEPKKIKESNEGFMIMPDGTRSDHFLLEDDD